MKNSLFAQLSAVTTSAKDSKNTPVKKASFESYISKLTPEQQKAMIEARSVAMAKKAEKKAETPAQKADTVIYVPCNDRGGVYLFAYTHAVMNFIKSLPVQKQVNAAKALHGSSAITHHGKTKRISLTSNGVQYDEKYFNCDSTKGTDPKRFGAFTFVAMFASLITTGQLPAVRPEGFAWKNTACRKVTL